MDRTRVKVGPLMKEIVEAGTRPDVPAVCLTLVGADGEYYRIDLDMLCTPGVLVGLIGEMGRLADITKELRAVLIEPRQIDYLLMDDGRVILSALLSTGGRLPMAFDRASLFRLRDLLNEAIEATGGRRN